MPGSLYLREPPVGEFRYMTDPPSRKGVLMISGAATTVVAAVTVGLRFFTKTHIIQKKLETSDWVVFASMFTSILNLALVVKYIDHGLSYHAWDVLRSTFHVWNHVYSFLTYTTYILGVALPKVAMLLLYIELSPQRWIHRLSLLLAVFIMAYSATVILLELFSCTPIEALWTEEGFCLDTYPAYWTLSFLNIAMDVLILLLPVHIVWPLQLPQRQKLTVVALFAAGAIVCIIAIRRTVGIPVLEQSQDYDWDQVNDMMLSFFEVNAGIMCASVPGLRPFFRRYMPAMFRADVDVGVGVEANSVEAQNMVRRKTLCMMPAGDRQEKEPSAETSAGAWPGPGPGPGPAAYELSCMRKVHPKERWRHIHTEEQDDEVGLCMPSPRSSSAWDEASVGTESLASPCHSHFRIDRSSIGVGVAT